jgi:predicted permease
MRWLAKLRRRARLVYDRSTVEREMDDEIRFHLQMEAEELARFGTSAADAPGLARRRFGGVARYRDEARDARGGRWLEELRQDARYALRVLSRGRGFVAVSLLTLALGVGANTAIFSVVRGVLLRELPYADPERLLVVQSVIRGTPTAVSPPDFMDWRAQSRAFSGLAAYFLSTTNLTGRGDPERLTEARVSANFFDLLGVQPTHGRSFRPGEDTFGAPRVAILSDGLWRRRFGEDPAIVGRTITLDDYPTTVVGIAPAQLRFPVGVDLWLTTRFDERELAAKSRGARWIAVLGRLAPLSTLASASAEMSAIAARLAQLDPRHDADVAARVAPLREDLVGDVRRPLLILLGAVGFVMLIACVNVASLSLARTSARGSELAVRVALGAGRARLARQILTESVVLALGGGVLGTLLAFLVTRALVALAPGDLPLMNAVRIDGVVLAFALMLTVASGVLFGIVPAMHGAGRGIADRLRATRGTSLGSGAGRLRQSLVVTEVALAIALLAGAGLLVRSFLRLTSVDPGFRADRVATFSFSLSPVRYPNGARQALFAHELLSRLGQVPGVRSAGISFSLPLTNSAFGFTFAIGGRPEASGPDEPRAQVRVATPDYFRTMGIPLLRGRGFMSQDNLASPPVLLISQAAARRYWPNEDPIGQTVKTGWGSEGGRLFGGTIIGVVGDVRQYSLTMQPEPEMYGPLAQWPLDELSVVMQSAGSPASLLPVAREVVRQLDPELPVYDARPMSDLVRASVAQRRFYATLLGTFAVLALVLAAIGIYGVIAYTVQQRRRELGIRIALGATPRLLVELVLRQGLLLTLTGSILGLIGAGALTRVLEGQLFGVAAIDPLTFALVPAVLLVVALAACIVPVRRALAVDPATAIRADS